jgi:hypothetical protein
MLAKIKAELAAVKAYVVVHYKQLVAAVVAGKFSAAIVAGVLHVVAVVKALL